MEDVVSFDLAKRLKEKGFDYKGLFVYNKEQIINPEIVKAFGELSDDGYYELTKEGGGRLDWDFVYIDEYELLQYRDVKAERDIVKAPTISQVLKWLREEKKIHICVDFDKDMIWYYQIAEYHTTSYKHQQYGYNSYEETAIAGIEYVLDNLI